MFKPRIYLVGEDNDSLIALEEIGYLTEENLHELLAQYPDLLPGDQIDPENPRRWLLVSREIGIPGEEGQGSRWRLDHMFLDQDGIPTLVECKRSVDTRIRREVVAQMLDYAANAAAYWSADDLRESANVTATHQGRILDDEIIALIGDGGESFDVDWFWEQVETNLRSHRMRLVFAADRTPKELRRLVEFLNEEMVNVEVMSVEIRQYKRLDGVENTALVPRVVGITEAARSMKGGTKTGRRQWTEQQFFEVLQQEVDSKKYGLIVDLYRWCQNKAHRIWFGTGAKTGTFTFHYLKEGKTVSVFTVRTDGFLQLNYGWLVYQIGENLLERFHERLVTIPPFANVPAEFNRWISIELDETFISESYLKDFEDQVSWLGDAVAAAPAYNPDNQ